MNKFKVTDENNAALSWKLAKAWWREISTSRLKINLGILLLELIHWQGTMVLSKYSEINPLRANPTKWSDT